MKTITRKMKAWLTEHRAARDANPEDVENMAFSALDMADHGWILIGDAEITVTLRDRNEITYSQVAVLKEAKKRIQATAEAQINAIEGQVQSLLALPMEV